MLGGHFSAPIDTQSGPVATQYLVFASSVSVVFFSEILFNFEGLTLRD